MKIDLHVHSSEVSRCGQVAGAEMVRLYREAGFDAIVLTNHFNRYTADSYAAEGHKDFAKFYLEKFELARSAGEKIGLRVFCGYEIHFDENLNDYLVYGLPDDLLRKYSEIFAMRAVDFCKLAAERGFLCYQAHPFRNSMTILPPSALYGIEVRNGHPRHDGRNEIAAAWAKKFNLHGIAGSDAHDLTGIGTAGIETTRDIRTMDELVAMLRDDDYTIF